MRRELISIIAVCGFLAAPAWGSLVNLVENGSFETYAYDPLPSAGFVGLPGDSEALTGWTVVGSGSRVVDYIGLRFDTPYGDRSVDLDGYYLNQIGNGGITQDIATVAGGVYELSFALAGNPEAGPSLKTMTVSAGNMVDVLFSFDTTGYTMQNMGWTTESLTFTALSGTTTLLFQSTTNAPGYPIGYGPMLDNVSVVAVPVPGSVLLAVLGLGLVGRKLRRFV